MAGIVQTIEKALTGFRGRTSVAPSVTAGVEIDEADVSGGYVVVREPRPQLRGKRRWTEYQKLVTETLIVAASVRYFLNLIASVEWTIQPPKDENGDPVPGSEEVAKFIEECKDDMETSWSRIVRRAAMFRFNGFSIQEWTSKKRDDGKLGMLDIEARPCHTIERWDLDAGRSIKGVTQWTLADGEVYLPRGKIIYLVDDALEVTPEGTGLFRHLYRQAERLRAIEELEEVAFETDLRGTPIGRVPLGEMRKAIDGGQMTLDQVKKARAAVDNFVKNKLLNRNKGAVLDSETYLGTTADGNRTPSAVRKWDVELVKGDGSSPQAAAAEAIKRINNEMAVLLGTEHLLLGSDGSGSLALGSTKLSSFFLVVSSTLGEIAEAFNRDWVAPIGKLNGIKPELLPKLKPQDIDIADVEAIATALSQLASAGAPLSPDDPAIDEVRSRMGLPPAPPPPELLPAEQALVDRVRSAGVDPNAVKEYKPAPLDPNALQPKPGDPAKPGSQPAKPGAKPTTGAKVKPGSGGAKAELKKLFAILGLNLDEEDD